MLSYGQSRPENPPLKAMHYTKRLWQSLQSPHLYAPAALLSTASKYVPEEHSHHSVHTSWSAHNAKGKLMECMQACNFTTVQVDWLGHDVYFTSAQEYLAAQLAIATEFRKRLSSVSETSLQKLKEEFIARSQDVLDKHGALVYPYGALFFTALKK